MEGVWLRFFLEFANSPASDPLGNVNISVGIKTGVVWMDKLPVLPLRFVAANGPFAVRFDSSPIVAEYRQVIHFGIQKGDATEQLWIELSGTAAERADDLNTRDRGDSQRIPPDGTPGYTVLSARAGYEFNDHFSVIAGVENFNDEAYRAHGSGQNEPGANFILSASLKF